MKKMKWVVILTLLATVSAYSDQAASTDAQKTYQDIKKTFGIVPQFLKNFPQDAITGAWLEMKSTELNPNTAIPSKYKELIGLAVAAQVPCNYCVYFHTQAAKSNGATEQEVRETLAMAGLTRHWSTFLNGSQQDMTTFRRETDQILNYSRQQASMSRQPASETKVPEKTLPDKESSGEQ